MAFEDLLAQEPAILSGVSEFDETFVLDCYKGAAVPEAGRKARKHGARVANLKGICSRTHAF